MNLYKAKPLSRKKIQESANRLRNVFDISLEEAFPVVEFLEIVIPELGYTIEICELSELKDEYALTRPKEKVLKIREDVYVNATKNSPRDLFTIAHEIGHVFFHDATSIALARGDCKIQKFEDPEWQANTFAAELLVPSNALKGKTVEEVVEIYKCSRQVAEIQLAKTKKLPNSLKVW